MSRITHITKGLKQVKDAIGHRHLAGGRYYNRDTMAAITLGMTTTGVYVEPTPTIPEYQSSSNKPSEMAW